MPTTTPMIAAIDQVSFHRNGICGAPFTAVLFRADLQAEAEGPFAPKGRPAQPKARMLGIVFDEPAHCAVICLDRIDTDGVKFGHNSWRGDQYEPELREAIRTHESAGSMRMGPFAIPFAIPTD